MKRVRGWRLVRVVGAAVVLLCLWAAISHPSDTTTSHTRSTGDWSLGFHGLRAPATSTPSHSDLPQARPHPLKEPDQIKESEAKDNDPDNTGPRANWGVNPRYESNAGAQDDIRPRLQRNRPFFKEKRLNIPGDYGEYDEKYSDVDEEDEKGKEGNEEAAKDMAIEEEEDWEGNVKKREGNYIRLDGDYEEEKRKLNEEAEDRAIEEGELKDEGKNMDLDNNEGGKKANDKNVAMEEGDDEETDKKPENNNNKYEEKYNVALEEKEEEKGEDVYWEDDEHEMKEGRNAAVEEDDDVRTDKDKDHEAAQEDVGGDVLKDKTPKAKSQKEVKDVENNKHLAEEKKLMTNRRALAIPRILKEDDTKIGSINMESSPKTMNTSKIGSINMKSPPKTMNTDNNHPNQKSNKLSLNVRKENSRVERAVGNYEVGEPRRVNPKFQNPKNVEAIVADEKIMNDKETKTIEAGNREHKNTKTNKLNVEEKGTVGNLNVEANRLDTKGELTKTNAEQAEDEYYKNLDQEMEDRRERIRDVCNRYGLGPHGSPDASSTTIKHPPTPNYDIFYIDRPDGLAWCPLYKVASTSWLYTFLTLAGLSESYVQNTHEQVSHVARRVWPSLEYFEAEKAMHTCLKFLVVRHPFERLVSAFRDKLENTNIGQEHGVQHFYEKYGKEIVALYRPGGKNGALPSNRYSQDMDDPQIPKPKGIEPTFPEFVRYLIDTELVYYADDHWMPYYLHCTPCMVDYDIIAKFETLDRDQNYIIYTAGLQEKVKPFWKHLTKGKKTVDMVKKYFATITKAELLKLFGKFKVDFELFGYSIAEYLDYVMPEG